MSDHILGTRYRSKNVLVPVGIGQKKVMVIKKLQIVENPGFQVSFE